jgi:hypothetical protein
MRKSTLSAIALTLFPLAAFAQPAGWNDPFPPHRVMDNLYYVGTKELRSTGSSMKVIRSRSAEQL